MKRRTARLLLVAAAAGLALTGGAGAAHAKTISTNDGNRPPAACVGVALLDLGICA